ncbi:MAG: TPM domain-containing protein, partial [Bacteroidales bacterium]
MAAFLSSQERKQIVSAITQAELNTSGEIRVHVETYCPSSSIERAIFVFNQLKMYKTKERNSVLIYFATESKKFAVIGDTGINAVVPEDFWESIKETMRVSFMDGYFVEGICKGVKEIGQKL